MKFNTLFVSSLLSLGCVFYQNAYCMELVTEQLEHFANILREINNALVQSNEQKEVGPLALYAEWGEPLITTFNVIKQGLNSCNIKGNITPTNLLLATINTIPHNQVPQLLESIKDFFSQAHIKVVFRSIEHQDNPSCLVYKAYFESDEYSVDALEELFINAFERQGLHPSLMVGMAPVKEIRIALPSPIESHECQSALNMVNVIPLELVTATIEAIHIQYPDGTQMAAWEHRPLPSIPVPQSPVQTENVLLESLEHKEQELSSDDEETKDFNVL